LIHNITADINNGCKVNVDYEPPEDGLVKAETCSGIFKYAENLESNF
jgi:hypothetical protein